MSTTSETAHESSLNGDHSTVVESPPVKPISVDKLAALKQMYAMMQKPPAKHALHGHCHPMPKPQLSGPGYNTVLGPAFFETLGMHMVESTRGNYNLVLVIFAIFMVFIVPLLLGALLMAPFLYFFHTVDLAVRIGSFIGMTVAVFVFVLLGIFFTIRLNRYFCHQLDRLAESVAAQALAMRASLDMAQAVDAAALDHWREAREDQAEECHAAAKVQERASQQERAEWHAIKEATWRMEQERITTWASGLDDKWERLNHNLVTVLGGYFAQTNKVLEGLHAGLERIQRQLADVHGRHQAERDVQQLNAMAPCPAGRPWAVFQSGFRCQGGSHYACQTCLREGKVKPGHECKVENGRCTRSGCVI